SKINEAGTTYYVVIPATGAAPTTSAQIKAGQDGNGAAAFKAGSITMTANTDATATITGLNIATAYNLYVVSQDNIPNLQTTFSTIIIPNRLVAQTITFNTIAPVTYGDASFALNATASSGLPV